MRKMIALVLVLALASGLSGCASRTVRNDAASSESRALLTLEEVIELSEKGGELTWSDFEEYQNTGDIGSGLHILGYDIDEAYYLLIGGGSFDAPPLYIQLVSKEDDGVSIDIRTGSVVDFVSSRNE